MPACLANRYDPKERFSEEERENGYAHPGASRLFRHGRDSAAADRHGRASDPTIRRSYKRQRLRGQPERERGRQYRVAATDTDTDVYVPAHTAAYSHPDLHLPHAAATTAVEPASAASAEPEPVADGGDSLNLAARTPGVGQR
jgi:hypothetical protein